MSVEWSVKRGFRGGRRRIQARPRDANEEHFVLRVSDISLAERIQSALRQEIRRTEETETEDLDSDTNSSKSTTHIEHPPIDIRLEFVSPTRAKLVVNGDAFPVCVMDMPTTVESFKTMDDVHCVKVSRVNQILIVGEDIEECEDGVCLPFDEVRDRIFRPDPDFPKDDVAYVEDALLSIFEGWAPYGWQFIDIQEHCVNENGRLVWRKV